MSAYRTFGDILAAGRFSHIGNCRFCKSYDSSTAYYSTRHSVCKQCCEKRATEVLPSVLNAESRARNLLTKKGSEVLGSARFLSALSGASFEYCDAIMRGPVAIAEAPHQ